MSPPDCTWLRGPPIAHRGLHDVHDGRPENSCAAFQAAIAAGYAIELDVRMTRDGNAAVFHDETLERLTEATGPLRHRTTEELRRLTLQGTSETIPMLADVLTLVRGRVPLLIEIKAPTRRIGRLEQRIVDDLRRYSGPLALQSFNPICLRWLRDHAPEMCRGLLSADYMKIDRHIPTKFSPSWASRFALKHLLAAPFLRPHFIAYEVNALPGLAPALAKLLGLPLVAWTVSSERHLEISSAYADNIIFEGVVPPLRRAS